MAFNRWRYKNKEFEKKTYISSFMFQALAYKELAIQMGAKEGLSPEHVISMERDYMDRVLNDDNKDEHYTGHSNLDWNDTFLSEEYKNVLKAMNLPNRIEEWFANRRNEALKDSNTKPEPPEKPNVSKTAQWGNWGHYLMALVLLALVFFSVYLSIF